MTKIQMTQISVALIILAGCGGGGGSGGSVAVPNPSDTPPTISPQGDSSLPGPSGSGTTDGNTAPSWQTATSRVAMMVALPGPPGGMQLRDLNDNGHAAGIATTGNFPMSVSTQNYHIANADNFYQGNGTAFPTTFAGNNAAGVIAGLAQPLGQSAFAYTWNGASINRILPAVGESIRSVIGIADDGAVILNQTVGGQAFTAMRYRNGALEVLPPMTASGNRGWAEFSSNNGTVLAGFYNPDARETWVFVWRNDGTTRSIPSLRRPTYGHSITVAMNNREHILINNLDHAYVYTPEGGFGLGKLPGNSSGHNFSDLNDLDDAVGSYGNGPLLYLNGTLYDLINYAEVDKLGWRLLTAERINNRRQILGRGMFNGQERWYLMTLK